MSYKSDPQEFPTRVSHKSVPQERPRRVSHKSVLQECHLDICSCSNVFAFGFVGPILFLIVLVFKRLFFALSDFTIVYPFQVLLSCFFPRTYRSSNRFLFKPSSSCPPCREAREPLAKRRLLSSLHFRFNSFACMVFNVSIRVLMFLLHLSEFSSISLVYIYILYMYMYLLTCLSI